MIQIQTLDMYMAFQFMKELAITSLLLQAHELILQMILFRWIYKLLFQEIFIILFVKQQYLYAQNKGVIQLRILIFVLIIFLHKLRVILRFAQLLIRNVSGFVMEILNIILHVQLVLFNYIKRAIGTKPPMEHQIYIIFVHRVITLMYLQI